MKKAALVLSGGSALGAAHIGVIKELEARGYSFDYIAGVSAGSIVGALVATGHSATAILELMRQLKLGRMAFDLTRNDFGVFGGKKLYAFLERALGKSCIEDAAIPLRIGVTDFTTGERVILKQGKIADAVRGSCSVPGIFEPFYHKEQKRWLVDGFLTGNLPLDIATNEYTGDTIFAIDVGASFSQNVDFSSTHWFPQIGGIKTAAERMMRIMFLHQREYLPEDKRVIHIVPDLSAFSSMDYLRLDKIVAAGKTAAEAAMQK